MQDTNPIHTKIKTCPNLSNTFTIEYRITDTEIQLISNSGGGQFSKETISLDTIIEILPHSPFTSVAVRPAIKARSLNTSGFLLAVLLAEELVVRVPGIRRQFVRALNIESAEPAPSTSVEILEISPKKSLFDPPVRSPDADGISTVSTPATQGKSVRKTTRSKSRSSTPANRSRNWVRVLQSVQLCRNFGPLMGTQFTGSILAACGSLDATAILHPCVTCS